MTPDPKCEGCAHYYQCCFMGETLYCCIYCLHGAEFNLPPRRRTAAGRLYKYKKCPYKSRYRWTSGDFYKTADAPPPRRATASAMAGQRKGAQSRSVPVRCLETDMLFPSVSAAERELGIAHGSIGKCLRRPGLTAGGLHWERVRDAGRPAV